MNITLDALKKELIKTGWIQEKPSNVFEEHTINGVEVVYDVLKRLLKEKLK